jgi:hypothetical protein
MEGKCDWAECENPADYALSDVKLKPVGAVSELGFENIELCSPHLAICETQGRLRLCEEKLVQGALEQ